MKKFHRCLLLLSISAFFQLSCSKKEAKSIFFNRINQVKSFQILEDRKLSYKLLSENEQALIWKTHLQHLKSVVNFSTEQINIINEAINFLVPSNFKKNAAFVKTDKFEIWKYKATQLFNTHERVILFDDVKDFSSNELRMNSNTAAISPMNAPINPESCGCNSEGNGDFCGNMNSSSCYGAYTYSCEQGLGNCTASSSGCGWFWAYSCSGGCQLTFTPGPCYYL